MISDNKFRLFYRMLRHIKTLSRFLQPAIFPQSIVGGSGCLRNFSLLVSNIITRSVQPAMSCLPTTTLLQPTSLTMNFDRGMKQKGVLRRRCKDCYFVRRFDRLYVLCTTHPRHKQMAMKKKEKNTWLLTDATQSKKRAF